MATSFEVKECDLLGRLGVLSVGQRRLETPCLLPVVHPVSQMIAPSELLSMGFRGLMTNSYILRSRRREEALREGVHKILSYEGFVMTDSGGYQVLEYGDLGVRYGDVAAFQSGIGSDAAVTLDRPTGYPQNRPAAEDSVDYSMRNALKTLKEFGEGGTLWIGPVQGGLYLDLVKRSAAALAAGGFQMLALGSPVQVMQNYMFPDLARMILATRKAVPYSVPLHLFGAGHPLTMALAVALGCDTFDSASYVLFARRGRYMSPSGVAPLESMKSLPCSCPVCSKTSVKELLERGHADRTKALALHNLHVLRAEVESCKEAISEGTLWDLVVERSMAHPMLRKAVPVMVENAELLAEGTPAIKDRGLFLRDGYDLRRPELLNSRERLARSLKRSAPKAALMAHGGSPTHGVERKLKDKADVYKLHLALGPYPPELDFTYPFAQTSAADELREADVKRAVTGLRGLGYRSVKVVGGRKRPVRSRPTQRAASPSPR